jgi:hypothetical protein
MRVTDPATGELVWPNVVGGRKVTAVLLFGTCERLRSAVIA